MPVTVAVADVAAAARLLLLTLRPDIRVHPGVELVDFGVLLLHAKNQIDPLIQVVGNVPRLEDLAVLVDEVEGTARPGGKDNVVDGTRLFLGR